MEEVPFELGCAPEAGSSRRGREVCRAGIPDRNRVAKGRDRTLWHLGGEHGVSRLDSVLGEVREGTLVSESAVLAKGIWTEF